MYNYLDGCGNSTAKWYIIPGARNATRAELLRERHGYGEIRRRKRAIEERGFA
jgi:hypothetical protein